MYVRPKKSCTKPEQEKIWNEFKMYRADEEACLAKETRQKSEEHKRAQLKVEEGIHLDLEVRRRAEE